NGTDTLANDDGILIIDSDGNRIGAPAPNETVPGRNVIFGNRHAYLEIRDTSSGNIVQANHVGTDVTGLVRAPNPVNVVGVLIHGGHDNVIGATTANLRNIISGNARGVEIGGTSHDNLVQGNWIGVDATGAGPLGNTVAGVFIDNSPGNTIGGTT